MRSWIMIKYTCIGIYWTGVFILGKKPNIIFILGCVCLDITIMDIFHCNSFHFQMFKLCLANGQWAYGFARHLLVTANATSDFSMWEVDVRPLNKVSIIQTAC